MSRRRADWAWALALFTFALHVATNGRYGYFRDELYFIACGQHPAFGYVDQPPLIALLAAGSDLVSRGSLLLFRMPAALAHAALVFATMRVARRLGGGSAGCVIAGLAVLISPSLLVGGHLLTMNGLEPLFWLAAGALLIRLIDAPTRARWALLGVVIGLGTLNKHSMVFYSVALLVGLLATPERRILRTRDALITVAVAALLVLPHAIWQIRNGFPMLELLRNGQLYKNAPFSPIGFVVGQLLEQHPLNAIVWIAGLVFLFRTPRWRALGIAYLTIFALFVLMKAKDYYLSAAYPLLFAAGGVALERALGRVRWLVPPLWIAGGAVTAPLVIPILPAPTLVAYQAALGFTPPRLEQQAYSALPQHLADEFGWEGLADTVARVYFGLTADERRQTVIFAQNYGQAGAIDHFGPARGLPPASSRHNNYFLWGPQGDGELILIIGGEPADHRKHCASVEEMARTPPDAYAIPREANNPIFLCRHPTPSLRAMWPGLKLYI